MFTPKQLRIAYKRSGNHYAGSFIYQLKLTKGENYAKVARQREVKKFIIDNELY